MYERFHPIRWSLSTLVLIDPFSAYVFDDDELVAQSGSSSYVSQIVYALDTCYEGDSIRECASYAGYERP